MNAPQIGVVLVTHNSSQWISSTLDSIAGQTVQPTRVLIVDDHSVDDTIRNVNRWIESLDRSRTTVQVLTSTDSSADTRTRIARNFAQGVLAMQDLDLVALGDHDDMWLPERLEVQSRLMRDEGAILLASNGVIGNSSDTLFGAFDVPADFSNWNAPRKLRHVLRHSVATGGASMLRLGALTRSPNFVPPRGWLHDRWWSIVAAARGGLQVSEEPVIRYRLSDEQSVGLNRGRQEIRGMTRLRSVNSSDVGKLVALHSLKREAAPELRRELSWGRLLKTLA